MILIITNKEDVHPTPVIELLKAENASVFRLNTEALLTDYEFCWRSRSKRTDFWIKNIQNGLEFHSAEITSVWERRPEAPSALVVQNTPEINQHNLKEALGFLQFLRYSIKDIYSIGSIVNDRVAASKILQLQTAHKVGFTTPDTCFSNRKEDVLEWAAPHEYVVLKSIENDNVWNDEAGVEYVFYTQKIKSNQLAGLPDEAFSQTVSYLQNYMEKSYELRITVVDEKVLACKIDSQLLDEDKGKIDWRQGYEHGLKHEVYELPQAISDRCVLFLQQLGLHFGCFDFIVTPAGDFVFLECNPNGQWLWIEDATGLRISKAIAMALMKNNN
jgi:glutathione synthase/RimK-type ligase-like ATP-grasp enzyme